MKFDRKDPGEQQLKDAAKDKAKKEVAKKIKKELSKKAGEKAAGGAAAKAIGKKIAAIFGSAIGGPGFFIFLAAIVVLFILPGMIFSSSFGVDSADGDKIPTTIGSRWYEDEEAAINSIETELYNAAFWSDLGNWLATGQWGQSQETFKTELADAEDEASAGYFSSSNKLVALLNEIYRHGVNGNAAGNKARSHANANKDSLISEAADSYAVDEDNVTWNISKKDLWEYSFLSETTYLMAAASEQRFENDEFDQSASLSLDTAMQLTGLRPLSDSSYETFLWEPNYDYEMTEREEQETRTRRKRDADGNLILDDNGNAIYEDYTVSVRYVDIDVEYYGSLNPDYKDKILEYCGIDGDDEELKEMVQVSANELLKFYRPAYSALDGDLGLPLPSGTYSVTCPFGCSCSIHQGNHRGQDFPAAEGTPTYAVADGVVAESGWHDSWGYYVKIDFGVNQNGDSIKALYAHHTQNLVSAGDAIAIGEAVGMVGSTGNSTGNHLHFGYYVNDQLFDPMQGEWGAFVRENAR